MACRDARQRAAARGKRTLTAIPGRSTDCAGLPADAHDDLEGAARRVDRRADELDLAGRLRVGEPLGNDLDPSPRLTLQQLLLGQVDAREQRLDGRDLEERLAAVLDDLLADPRVLLGDDARERRPDDGVVAQRLAPSPSAPRRPRTAPSSRRGPAALRTLEAASDWARSYSALRSSMSSLASRTSASSSRGSSVASDLALRRPTLPRSTAIVSTMPVMRADTTTSWSTIRWDGVDAVLGGRGRAPQRRAQSRQAAESAFFTVV